MNGYKFADVDYIDLRNINEYVKKQDVIDLCYMLQDKSSEQGQVLFEQIISAIEDMKPEEYNTKKILKLK